MPGPVFKIAICDDEPNDLHLLIEKTERVLEREKIPYEILPFESAQMLLEDMEKGKEEYHLLILDIVMDGLNGMELAAALRRQGEHVCVIFVSANREYALMGYEVEAARYLAKPVDEEKLLEGILYCRGKCLRKKELLVNTGKEMRRIPIHKLAFVETNGKGALLTAEGEKIKCRMSISELEQELEHLDFCRCHQSFLVNLSYVEEIIRSERKCAEPAGACLRC